MYRGLDKIVVTVPSVHPVAVRCGFLAGSAADGHGNPASFNARAIRATEMPGQALGEYPPHHGRGVRVRFEAVVDDRGSIPEAEGPTVYRTPWSIGYVEHACSQGLLPFAAIRNQAGNYVIPSAQSVAADAAWKPGITPADFSVVNQPGAASYRSAATAGRWPAPTGASE